MQRNEKGKRIKYLKNLCLLSVIKPKNSQQQQQQQEKPIYFSHHSQSRVFRPSIFLCMEKPPPRDRLTQPLYLYHMWPEIPEEGNSFLL